MPYLILGFLLKVIVTLVGGACLLRMAMRWRRMSFANPLGNVVQALTGRLVRPVERVLAPRGRLDIAALVVAWLLKMLEMAVMIQATGGGRWAIWPLLALLSVLSLAVSVAMAMIVISVVFSWMQNRGYLVEVIDRLTAPLLEPIRRFVPSIGGLDFSPLAAIVALQVVAMILGGMQANLLGTTVGLTAG